MQTRLRAFVATAALVAGLGLQATHAQTLPVADEPTNQAIARWHAATLTMIDPAFHDVVAASYGEIPGMGMVDLGNDAAIKKA